MSIRSRVKKLEKRTMPAEASGSCIEKAKMFIGSWTKRGIDTPWNDSSTESILALAQELSRVPDPEKYARILLRAHKCGSRKSSS